MGGGLRKIKEYERDIRKIKEYGRGIKEDEGI